MSDEISDGNEKKGPLPAPEILRRSAAKTAMAALAGDHATVLREAKKTVSLSRHAVIPDLARDFFKSIGERDDTLFLRSRQALFDHGTHPLLLEPPRGHFSAATFAVSAGGMESLSFLLEREPGFADRIPSPKNIDEHAGWLKTLPPSTFHPLMEAVCGGSNPFPLPFSNNDLWELFGVESIARARREMGDEAFHGKCRTLAGKTDDSFRNNAFALARISDADPMALPTLDSMLSPIKGSSRDFLEKTATLLMPGTMLFIEHPASIGILVKNLGVPVLAATGLLPDPESRTDTIGKPDGQHIRQAASRMGSIFERACRSDDPALLSAVLDQYPDGFPTVSVVMTSLTSSPAWHAWLTADIESKSPGTDHSKRLGNLVKRWRESMADESEKERLEADLPVFLEHPPVSEPDKTVPVKLSFEIDLAFSAVVLGAGEKCMAVFAGRGFDISELDKKCRFARGLPGKSDLNSRVTEFLAMPWVRSFFEIHALDRAVADAAPAARRAPGL